MATVTITIRDTKNDKVKIESSHKLALSDQSPTKITNAELLAMNVNLFIPAILEQLKIKQEVKNDG